MAPKKRKAVRAPFDDGDGHRATNKRIRNRASPSAFVKIYEILTVDQKATVVTMELDSMLDIKCFYLHSGLIKWLTSLYDPSSHEFVIPGRGRIPLDDRSAFRTLGLPIGSEEVFYSVDSDAEASLGPTLFPDDVSTPFFSRVCELLMDMTASDDKFKQLYLMFLVSIILRPTTRNRVSNRVYRVMANIDNVTNLNWCKFVVDEHHNALSEGKFNKGCLFHLQLLYVDSLDTSGLDIDLPEGRYAVNIWSAENIDKVLAADLNQDGTYGKLGLKPEFGVNHSLFGGAEGFDRWFNTNSHPACPNQE
uniref:Uncharacterized protein n=1 Tax=Avena sativa TaxID=4498 RepID=A0ACD5ZQK1_AVESA